MPRRRRYTLNDELKAVVSAAFGTLALAMSRKMSHRTLRFYNIMQRE